MLTVALSALSKYHCRPGIGVGVNLLQEALLADDPADLLEEDIQRGILREELGQLEGRLRFLRVLEDGEGVAAGLLHGLALGAVNLGRPGCHVLHGDLGGLDGGLAGVPVALDDHGLDFGVVRTAPAAHALALAQAGDLVGAHQVEELLGDGEVLFVGVVDEVVLGGGGIPPQNAAGRDLQAVGVAGHGIVRVEAELRQVAGVVLDGQRLMPGVRVAVGGGRGVRVEAGLLHHFLVVVQAVAQEGLERRDAQQAVEAPELAEVPDRLEEVGFLDPFAGVDQRLAIEEDVLDGELRVGDVRGGLGRVARSNGGLGEGVCGVALVLDLDALGRSPRTRASSYQTSFWNNSFMLPQLTQRRTSFSAAAGSAAAAGASAAAGCFGCGGLRCRLLRRRRGAWRAAGRKGHAGAGDGRELQEIATRGQLLLHVIRSLYR